MVILKGDDLTLTSIRCECRDADHSRAVEIWMQKGKKNLRAYIWQEDNNIMFCYEKSGENFFLVQSFLKKIESIDFLIAPE